MSHVLHIIEIVAILWIGASVWFALGAFWGGMPR